MAVAVKQDKLDGFLMDEPLARMLLDYNPSLTLLDGYLTRDSYAFALPKTAEGAALRDELFRIKEYIRSEAT